jgi:hypothetical protein
VARKATSVTLAIGATQKKGLGKCRQNAAMTLEWFSIREHVIVLEILQPIIIQSTNFIGHFTQ